MASKPQALQTIVPDRPSHDRRWLLDSGNLRGELGWERSISFEGRLRMAVEWYRADRDWWVPLRERAPVRETAWT